MSIREIHQYIDLQCSFVDIEKNVKQLLVDEKVFFVKGNYLLENDKALVIRKKEGALNAIKAMRKAQIISSIIYWFPFVRMVAISGSLSKNYSDKNSDIDFFILTTEANLWTARTMLHILKKFTFLINMQHSFCMNYFLAIDKLTIEEQNYFTAIELSTLIPMHGLPYYHELIKANGWLKSFLPNKLLIEYGNKRKYKSVAKIILEYFLRSTKLNEFCMSFTDKKWRKKWVKRGISEVDYELAFKTKKYVSKNHPDNHQKQILDTLKNNE